ncbi:CpsD/CapB family tyrosine-protein kinase [Alicyclobacillus mengziensis]|uniref:non-specific protein-tyrosine kinase n=1 Tax=Alicyclobacillus mengziensis TaxID=2931921 RepID=A0A9X7VVM1_9BACL|nr:CpsD/CapB family tyrosine-protein kinase [Alicyclobacillus mengziensis]QSO45435.1 CpsD/CapB family tyrosine-protein kinase [Alicyclobacillus mengziensis]
MAIKTTTPIYPITQTDPESSYAEAYRTIETNIQLLSMNVKAFLVTSARPGEGKTSTAANLAIVAAQATKRVLLVDADLRHPQLAHRFHVSTNTGLTKVLRQGCELQEAVLPTEVEGLHLLPSGPIGINSPSLLSSLAFTSLVGKLKSKYDLVIFDAPPVLPVSDALVLSRNVDGIVFVVDGAASNRLAALRAINEIHKVQGKIIGGILNRGPRDNDNAYYYTPTFDPPSHESTMPLN